MDFMGMCEASEEKLRAFDEESRGPIIEAAPNELCDRIPEREYMRVCMCTCNAIKYAAAPRCCVRSCAQQSVSVCWTRRPSRRIYAWCCIHLAGSGLQHRQIIEIAAASGISPPSPLRSKGF